MRNFVNEQLTTFLQSILLGLAVGVVYDLLRPFRLRLPRFSWALDCLYCLCAATGVFLFTLNQLHGQLRIYILLGLTGGTVLFFTLFSTLLRPVWEFWTDTLVFLLHLMSIPYLWLKKLNKYFIFHLKNIFLFTKKCYTIRKSTFRRYRGNRGGSRRGKVQKGKEGSSAD